MVSAARPVEASSSTANRYFMTISSTMICRAEPTQESKGGRSRPWFSTKPYFATSASVTESTCSMFSCTEPVTLTCLPANGLSLSPLCTFSTVLSLSVTSTGSSPASRHFLAHASAPACAPLTPHLASVTQPTY